MLILCCAFGRNWRSVYVAIWDTAFFLGYFELRASDGGICGYYNTVAYFLLYPAFLVEFSFLALLPMFFLCIYFPPGTWLVYAPVLRAYENCTEYDRVSLASP